MAGRSHRSQLRLAHRKAFLVVSVIPSLRGIGATAPSCAQWSG
ncbi:hypothetical protein [Mycobacterium sp.]|nr:hypothetical protein [Mycobacterium sp.]